MELLALSLGLVTIIIISIMIVSTIFSIILRGPLVLREALTKEKKEKKLKERIKKYKDKY